jgi:hypothetical protein
MMVEVVLYLSLVLMIWWYSGRDCSQDMKDIQNFIDVLEKDKHKKLNFKNIINILAKYYLSEYLKKYKSFIHEYVNQKDNKSEVIHVKYITILLYIHL